MINHPRDYVIAVQEQPLDGLPDIECLPPPAPPCVVPATPTLFGSVRAQTATIEATIPTDYPAVIAHVRVQEEVAGGARVDFYETRSTAVIPASGNTVRIGLPGLRKDTRHWVNVGFCRNLASYPGLRGCNCWSDPVLVDTTGTGFSASKPSGAPEVTGTTLALKVEDDFVRPPTTTQTAPNEASGGGDGLGPKAVWLDGWDPPVPEGSFIDASGDHAVVSNGLVRYARPAKSFDQYATTRFWVTDTASTPGTAASYNLDLQMRHTGDGTATQFFVAKLVYKQLERNTFPALALINETQISPDGVVNFASLTPGVDYIDLTGSGAGSVCPGQTQNKCTGTPPLLTGTSRASNYSVLSMAARGNVNASETDLVAAVGWNCDGSGSGSVYACANVCCLAKSDLDQDRVAVTGQFGLFGHHSAIRYRLEWVRFGDSSQGSWP